MGTLDRIDMILLRIQGGDRIRYRGKPDKRAADPVSDFGSRLYSLALSGSQEGAKAFS
jgi:hypothetical protein